MLRRTKFDHTKYDTLFMAPVMKIVKFLRQKSPDGSIIMDSAGACSQVSSFDPEIQRGLAGDGLKVSQIMTLIDPDLTKSCKVMVVLETN